MRQRQVPCTARCKRLVFIITQADDGLRPALQTDPVEIGRSIVGRIGPKNHQRLDLSCFQRLRKVHDRACTELRSFKEIDCFADVLERDVKGTCQQMNGKWLPMTGYDETFASVRDEILR